VSRDGNILWGWQSQQPDGSWSLIAMFLATEKQAATMTPEQLRASGTELHVLVHRDPRIARGFRTQAMAHRDRFGQPVRFARFDLAFVVEEIDGAQPDEVT
jgi:hypothetical protein